MEVVVGTNVWDKGGDHYGVAKAFIHEKYNKDGYGNDIALLKLKKPITFSNKVQPIKYSSKVVPDGKSLKVR